MPQNKEQKQLRELFCQLASPFTHPGKSDTLRSYVMRKEGEKFERFISHGDLNKLFALQEMTLQIADDTPCLYGCCTWKKSSFDEAISSRNDGYVIIALNGSWLAVCQELDALRLYKPARTTE